jgi:peptidoglycan hydrolase-like protein with peptidoglycan-binding domain
MKRGILVKKVRIFLKSTISIVMSFVILLVSESSIMSVIASKIQNLEQPEVSISAEEITEALNNAEFVDISQDCQFVLADDSVEISDDYFPGTADINCVEYPQITNEYEASTISEDLPGDDMVYLTQKWLNQEYGDVEGFNPVTENGKTGWNTIYGLIRALQHELGITNLSNNFGSTTSKLYSENILRRQDGVKDNKYAILQGALWCKGYSPGYNISISTTGKVNFNAVFDKDVENAIKRLQADAGLLEQDGVVSLNIMKALMSMDSFKLLPSSYGSDSKIRVFQQWLNRNYEEYTGLNPCDGVYGRNTNKALVYALQAEEGLPVSVATGNFGNTTKLCCPSIPYYKTDENAARKYPGTANGDLYTYNEIQNFTKLMQFALYVNGFGDGIFDGIYDNATKQAVREFQEHHAILITGKVNLGTWLSLFISCGDKYRDAIAADCATILTEEKANSLVAEGFEYVGRYLTGTYGGGINKALSREEAELILESGLKFFPIYQDGGTTQSDFTAENGQLDGKAAVNAAKALGLPDDTIIYFAVDFDAMDYQITSNIIPYFKEVYDEVSSSSAYKVGVYGARNVCSRVSDKGYACSSFVGNMSTGFSGNLGFKMPSNWAFDQFGNKDEDGNYLIISSPDGNFEIDKDGVSGRDDGVSWLKEVEESDAFVSDKINLGESDEDELSGPVIDFFGNEVPLFKLDIAFDFKFAQIESYYDYEAERTRVIIGYKISEMSQETTGGKKWVDNCRQAYKEVKNVVYNIGKGNTRELTYFLKNKPGTLYESGLRIGFDYTSYTVGYLEFDKKGELVEGNLGVLGTTKFSSSYPIVPTVYIKFQVEGSLRTGLKFVKDDESETLDMYGNVNFTVKPSLGLEGNLYVARAYVGFSGELECSADFPFQSLKDSFGAEMSASFFIEWDALLWGDRQDWTFARKRLYPSEEEEKLSLNMYDNLSFIEPLSQATILSETNHLDVFKSSVQVYTAPKIVELGGGKLFMTYIDDAPNRTAENRTTLMYSIYNGSTWSTPQAVSDDGTADFESQITPDGTGGVHIIWQNANTIFSEGVTLEEMSKGMELHYSHWNGTTMENTTPITSSNLNLEMTYSVASSGNNIAVVWQENSNNDSLVMSGINSIHRRQFIDGAWQDVEDIASNLSTINSIETGYINGSNIVVYSAKSNLDTDLEILYYNGTQTTEFTNDDVHDYSVDILDDEIYWISNNSINCVTNGDISTKQKVQTFDGTVTKINVIGNDNGNKSIVWILEDETKVDFYATDFNYETNSYDAIRPITMVNGVIRGWDACLTTDGNIELLYCNAEILGKTYDDNIELSSCNSEILDETSDGNYYGTLSLFQKAEEDFCDISIISELGCSGDIAPNEELTLTTDIYNRGSLPINQFLVNIIDENGSIVQSNSIEKEVGVNEYSNIEFSFTLPETITRTDYKVKILPQQYDDINVGDNYTTLSVGFPDLVISSMEEVRSDLDRELHVTIKNQGYDVVNASNLSLYLDSYNGTNLETKELASIQPGEEVVCTFNLTESNSVPAVSEEPNYVYLSLETTETEYDYSNNYSEYIVYPDYSITLNTGTSGGTVSGTGIYIKDSLVEVNATPEQGYIFSGWYENNVKILGADSSYSFNATQDRILTAKFVQLDFCSIYALTSQTGEVDETNKYLRGIKAGGKVNDYFAVSDNGSLLQIENDYGNINATGTIVQTLSSSRTVIDEYIIVILGDVNGDGAIDGFDVITIDLYIANLHELTGAYLEAADINQDGLVDDSDYQLCIDISALKVSGY